MGLTRPWLRRRLGVFDMYALVHSDIQSTYYFLAGFIALYAGQYGFLGAAYGVLLMASIALTYGEMGSRFPETGGSYLYIKYSFGGLIAYFSAWLLAFDQIVMITYGTIDAAKIINKVLPDLGDEVFLAVVLTTALFILTILGVRETAALGKTVAILDLGVMPTLITTAILLNPAAPPFFNWGGVEAAGLFLAFSLLSRGFTGIDAIGQLAGEAKEPLVQVPKATILVITVGVFYGLGLMAAIMSALEPHEITDPAVAPLLLAERIHPMFFYLVVVNIFLVMITASLAGFISFSRMTYILSEEGLLPRALAKLHKKFRTPYVALAIAYVVSLMLTIFGRVEIVLAIYAIGSLLNYILVAAALAKASRSGTLHSAFKTPSIANVPLSAWIALALLPIGLFLTLLEKYHYAWALALWTALGGVMYFIRGRVERRIGER
ncbi:MAG: APC family permease [Pyrobaculum sp.]